MAIVVICWVSISLLFTLALLRAAARPRLRADQQITTKDIAVKIPAPKKTYPAQAPSRLVTSGLAA
jgi:hypothetical protein